MGTPSVSRVIAATRPILELSGALVRALAALLPVQRGYRLNADDVLRRDVINGLMCHGRIDFAGVEAGHAIRFTEYFAHALSQLDEQVADGLLHVEDDGVQLLPQG